MIKVVIADDHNMVREAWALLLGRDPNLSIVATCENGEQAVSLCKKIKPDVVLMDINMEPMNGIDATRAIREFSDERYKRSRPGQPAFHLGGSKGKS